MGFFQKMYLRHGVAKWRVFFGYLAVRFQGNPTYGPKWREKIGGEMGPRWSIHLQRWHPKSQGFTLRCGFQKGHVFGGFFCGPNHGGETAAKKWGGYKLEPLPNKKTVGYG